jgi:haloacid dehalogenase superfamily, subfamily IA, variant 3 with third motif having DD or ED
MLSYTCAIFDLDGTVLDSMYVWEKIDYEFLSKRGFDVPQNYCEIIAPMGFYKAAEYTIERFGLSERPEDLIEEWNSLALSEYENNITLKPNVKEYLSFLKQHQIKTGVATSSHKTLFERALRKNGVYDYFDVICTTDQVKRGKGYPDIYLYTAEKLGAEPCNCVVFEDILAGIVGAKAAGMFAVAIEEKASFPDKEKLIQLSDRYISDFADMMKEHR